MSVSVGSECGVVSVRVRVVSECVVSVSVGSECV